ncbi:MAG: hypothetical protein U0931_37095 [Vulcanimicrobiota bacterium]
MERAIELVSQANSSVGCSMAKSDELTLQMLAGEVRELKVKIKRWKTQLEENHGWRSGHTHPSEYSRDCSLECNCHPP